jgi:hypothetical protein
MFYFVRISSIDSTLALALNNDCWSSVFLSVLLKILLILGYHFLHIAFKIYKKDKIYQLHNTLNRLGYETRGF